MLEDLVQRGYARSSLTQQLVCLKYDAASRCEKMRRLALRNSDTNVAKHVNRVHLLVLRYSHSTRRLRFRRVLRRHISKFMQSDAAKQLAIDTWPSIVAYKAFPNMFLENNSLNAPVNVGGRDLL